MTVDPDRPMYRWRSLNNEQRKALLDDRMATHVPWHSPPHYVSATSLYMLTAACYEHRHLIGHSLERMSRFELELVETAKNGSRNVFAWVVLPNHYHLLVDTTDLKALLRELGKLHGRMSFEWNGQEGRRGRKVWHGIAETAMKSERYFWASFNDVIHNAVHHEYVSRWQDWPYSNAAQYLEEVGRDKAEQVWRAYPVLDYGKEWDPPGL